MGQPLPTLVCCIHQSPSPFMSITIMRILRLEPDDVIIPLFAVIAVAVACQGETFL